MFLYILCYFVLLLLLIDKKSLSCLDLITLCLVLGWCRLDYHTTANSCPSNWRLTATATCELVRAEGARQHETLSPLLPSHMRCPQNPDASSGGGTCTFRLPVHKVIGRRWFSTSPPWWRARRQAPNNPSPHTHTSPLAFSCWSAGWEPSSHSLK